MHWDEPDFPDLPDEAFEDEKSVEINDKWLRKADVDEQTAAMAQWFRARFWDPANETPYMSSEGGYIWIWGGPYDAAEELHGRFSGVVDDDAIQRAIDVVEEGGILEWAPTPLTYYDEGQDVVVDDRNEPTKWLEQRLGSLAAVLKLEGDKDGLEAVRNLAFAGAISALEAFLWETMAYWLDADERVVANLITKHPVFRDRSIKLGDIFETSKALKIEVKAHLQNVVWHRIENISPIFKYGLGVNLGFKGFEDAIQKRHDIVHRFGHDQGGNPVRIAANDVYGLIEKVKGFATQLDERIAKALRAGD